MAVVQGKLYVAGGYDETNLLATAEAYDPQQNRWETVANTERARNCCAGCAI